MHIEIFTDGRVLVDGQEVDSTWKAETVLKEFLTNPAALSFKKSKSKVG
ncbi:hypothetical protein HYY75_07275 [bacterium]|nr:hypothetical protein [bacterium]